MRGAGRSRGTGRGSWAKAAGGSRSWSPAGSAPRVGVQQDYGRERRCIDRHGNRAAVSSLKSSRKYHGAVHIGLMRINNQVGNESV